MNTTEIIEAINHWQLKINYKPIRCGNDPENHDLLVPNINAYGGVYLSCMQCNYTSLNIPEIVKNCLKKDKLIHIEKNEINHKLGAI